MEVVLPLVGIVALDWYDKAVELSFLKAALAVGTNYMRSSLGLTMVTFSTNFINDEISC